MQKKFLIFIRNLNNIFFLFFSLSFQIPLLAVNGLIPIDDTTIKLSSDQTLLTQRIDHHSHYVILKEDSNVLWKKKKF